MQIFIPVENRAIKSLIYFYYDIITEHNYFLTNKHDTAKFTWGTKYTTTLKWRQAYIRAAK
jgi:hypothetical protein